jgi:hypothetical protein
MEATPRLSTSGASTRIIFERSTHLRILPQQKRSLQPPILVIL